MAKVTYTEFVNTYVVKDGDPGNALYLNKAPLQLKTEVDENSVLIDKHEELLDILQGVNPAEWSVSTTYQTGDLVSRLGEIWKSLIDDNLGNTPDDGIWERVNLGSNYVQADSRQALAFVDAFVLDGEDLTLTKGDGTSETVTLTGIGSNTPALNSFTWGTSNGVLTAVMSDGNNKSIDLDGRYSLSSHTHSYNPTIGTNTDVNTSGATIIDNIYVTNGVVTSMGTRTLTADDIDAQPTLVSGTNIKTVNGRSIIGSGDIEMVGATGGGNNKIFYENDLTITTNYTIPPNKGASSTGPITINTAVTVTISDGSRWVVL